MWLTLKPQFHCETCTSPYMGRGKLCVLPVHSSWNLGAQEKKTTGWGIFVCLLGLGFFVGLFWWFCYYFFCHQLISSWGSKLILCEAAVKGSFHRVEHFTLWGASASVGSSPGSGYLVFRSQVSKRHGPDFIKSSGKDKGVSSYIFETAFKHLLKLCALSSCH